MSAFKKRLIVFALVLSVVLGLVIGTVDAAGQTVNLNQEPLYATWLRVIAVIKSSYVEDVPLEKILLGAIKGSFSALDPYSAYFTKTEFSSFIDSTITGEFGGIGVTIESKDGYITVVSPVRGSPADLAGLRPGDRIIEVDGKSVKGFSTDAAASLIKGQQGTTVILKVQKVAGAFVTLTITRALIKLTSVESMSVANGKIGIIRLSGFNQATAAEFAAQMNTMKANGVKGLVIDLRDNPGGLLQSAIDVLRNLIPSGPALRIIDRSGNETTLDSGSDATRLPMVLLINEGSASASEIVAGAVKDYGTAYLMGQKSFGKGSIQQLVPLEGGDGVKITFAHYLTPKRNRIDSLGVTPDMVIPDQWDNPRTAPPYVVSKEYATGDSSAEFNNLERSLIALSCLGSASGQYSQATSDAISAYQRNKGITVTGSLNSDTALKMNQDLAQKGIGGLDRQAWSATQILKLNAQIDPF